MKHASLTLLLLLLLAAPARAARVDTLALLSLTPGAQYDCVELDPGFQVSTGRHLTLTIGLDATGRYRLTLEQQVGAPPLAVPEGYLVVSRSSAGWCLWECALGWSAMDQRDNAAICPRGAPFPRWSMPDAPRHLAVPVRDGAGRPLPTGGVEEELIGLDYNEAQGLLISWTFDAGPSASLWSDGAGHLAGVELGWVLYHILSPIDSGTPTGVQ